LLVLVHQGWLLLQHFPNLPFWECFFACQIVSTDAGLQELLLPIKQACVNEGWFHFILWERSSLIWTTQKLFVQLADSGTDARNCQRFWILLALSEAFLLLGMSVLGENLHDNCIQH
jgi:hypothetical protein